MSEANGRMIFCTLFNWAYLPQGIALYRSLERCCRSGFVLYVLCIDGFTHGALENLKLPHLRCIPLRQIESEALRAARNTRTIGEFCWTCTTTLLIYLQDLCGPDAVITYVDADLSFFSDPGVVLDELGPSSILIHEHSFAPEYEGLQQAAGRFNVGLVAVRNDQDGRACLERWREQVFHECVFDPAAGKCGDQHYLDEWPQLYPRLVISSNPGVGLAPWNISKYRLARNKNGVTVDGRAAIFYHFHSLRLLRPRLGVRPTVMASGAYNIGDDAVELFYRPYASDLWTAVRHLDRTKEIQNLGHDFMKEFATLPHEYAKLKNGHLYFSFGAIHIPSKHNAQLMSWLYGIDADKSHL